MHAFIVALTVAFAPIIITVACGVAAAAGAALLVAACAVLLVFWGLLSWAAEKVVGNPFKTQPVLEEER